MPTSETNKMQRQQLDPSTRTFNRVFSNTSTTSTVPNDDSAYTYFNINLKSNASKQSTNIQTKSRSRGKRQVVQDKLWDVGSSFEDAFKLNKTQPHPDLPSHPLRPPIPRSISIDELPEHNYPKQDHREDIYGKRNVSTASTISSAASNIYRTVTGRKSSFLQRKRPTVSFPTTHTDDSLRSESWRGAGSWYDLSKNDQTLYWEHGDYFIACMPKQMEEIDEEIVEEVKVAKFYREPASTPVNELQGDEDMFDNPEKVDRLRIDARTDLTRWSVADIENYRDFVPIDLDGTSERIDRYRGLQSNGIQILATSLPQAHRQVENMSAYYCQPLIETAEQTKHYYHQPSPINFEDGDEWEDELDKTITYIPKNFGSREETVPKVWFRRREFLGKKSQPPVKSLILYLLGTGKSCREIAESLCRFDGRFVSNWTSRWWNGARIPEHWELDDGMVRRLCAACSNEDGTHEVDLRQDTVKSRTESRMSVNKAKLLIKRTVEEYMWWRLRGGEKLGNNGGVYGITSTAALVGFQAVTLPAMMA